MQDMDEEFKSMINSFVQSMPKMVTEVKMALEQQDIDVLNRIGHQLKGAGGSYGFPDITAAGLQLEKLATETVNRQQLETAVSELVQVCNRAQPTKVDS